MPEINEDIASLVKKLKSKMEYFSPETKFKDIKEIKSSLILVMEPEETLVYVLVVNKDASKNEFQRISCSGHPIGAYVQNQVDNTYILRCVKNFSLGIVRASFKAVMPGYDDWSARIPAPESVLKRYMNPAQREELRKFKEVYCDNQEFEIKFVQFLV